MCFVSGCAWTAAGDSAADQDDLARYLEVASEIEVPDVPVVQDPAAVADLPPPRIDSREQLRYRNLSLEEVTRIALLNSEVMRQVGGVVLRAPEAEGTTFDPAIRATDPRFGIEAALSTFDAQYNGFGFVQKNDRALNSNLSLGRRPLDQRLAGWQSQLTKRTAVGTTYTLRHRTDYDMNNYLTNMFPRSWTTNLEAEIRQPLLQGAGIEYGQIVGNGILGFSNGVLVARVNTDIVLTDFELAVRDLISNVENAYWDLYFAYRNLEARLAARDAALETWQRMDALRRGGRRSAADEAQARVQYFRFQRDVQNALAGRLERGTSTNNGTTGGIFNTSGGVYAAERRLRLLMGITATDGSLIRPSDEPSIAQVAFDFGEVSSEALSRRAELRQQRWRIKRRELELVASRQFLRRRLDAVGLYRFNGFGQDLIKAQRHALRFDNAYQVLTSGDFQEWQFGLEMSFPVGFRQAHEGIRNAQLQLARARAIAREQERQVMFGVVNALGELDRSYTLARTSYDVYVSAIEQVDAVEAAYEAGQYTTNVLLEVQRARADAATDYYRSLVEYVLAVKNVHLEKGSLLDYNNIWLSEGAWPAKAYRDAARRELLRGPARPTKERLERIPPVSAGVYPQRIDASGLPAINPETERAPDERRQPEELPPAKGEAVPAEALEARRNAAPFRMPFGRDLLEVQAGDEAVERSARGMRYEFDRRGGKPNGPDKAMKYGVWQGELWSWPAGSAPRGLRSPPQTATGSSAARR